MKMTTAGRVTLGFVFALAATACPEESDLECTETLDCAVTDVCVEGFCRQSCYTGDNCLEGFACQQGACMPSSVVAPDAAPLDAINKDAAPADSATDAGAGDSASSDAASIDAASADSSVADADQLDSVVVDAISPDVLGEDGGQPDSSAPDGAQPDGAQPDGARPDGAPFDAVRPDTAPPDAIGADAASPDSSVAPPLWWNPNWKRRVRVDIDASFITETLSDVPVLVRITGSVVDYGLTQDQGQDLRFTDPAGAPLAYEVERWDETGESVAWVKLPTVVGGTSDDFIWMYYGNPNATGRPDGATLWSNSYDAVWHLGAELVESSGSEPPAVPHSGATTDPGYIGMAQLLDGSNDYVQLAEESAVVQAASVMVLSAWINVDTISTSTSIRWIASLSTSRDPASTDSRYGIGVRQTDDLYLVGRSADSEGYKGYETTAGPLTLNTWHYVVGVIDLQGQRMEVYVDGELVSGAAQVFVAASTDDTPTTSVVLGSQDNHSSDFFDGHIDELRVARVTRSADWIRFQYGAATGLVTSFGVEESTGDADVGLAPVAVDDTAVTDEDQLLIIDVLANDSDPDSDPILVESVSAPTLGTIELLADQTLRFTPTHDANGSEQLTYVIGDGVNGTDSATINLTVTALPDDPVAFDDLVLTPLNTAAVVDVVANDDDVDGEALTVFSVGAATSGTAAVSSATEVSYTPAAGFLGHDSFTYTVADPVGGQDTATVWVSVYPDAKPLEFTDVTSTSGLNAGGAAYGVAWADYDADGYTDVWVGGIGRLYQNQGAGVFADSGETVPGERGGCWADPDNDGDLDLFTSIDNGGFYQNDGGLFTERTVDANLVGGNLGTAVWFEQDGDGWIDLFFPNGEAPWMEVRQNLGTAPASFTVIHGVDVGLLNTSNGETSTAADFDDDGDIDLWYSAAGGGILYENDAGTFTDVTVAVGINTSYTDAYVGVAFGDCDNDGDLDLFVGANEGHADQLYINTGGAFTLSPELSFDRGDSAGAAWGDVENDGDLDLAVAVDDAPDALYLNVGDCRFADAALVYGVDGGGASSVMTSLVDADNDGDLDLFSARSSSTNRLWLNEMNDGDYLRVIARGGGAGKASRDGIGTRIELWDATQSTLLATREIGGGSGRGSHDLGPVHFGLAQSWGGGDGSYVVKVYFIDSVLQTVGPLQPSLESVTMASTTLSHTIEVIEP